MNETIILGDRFEGVLLETCLEKSASRPRVRPLEYFGIDTRVEFPRNLREENPIGTRFRADVKICQKSKNGEPFGKFYLASTDKSIYKLENFKPDQFVYATRLNSKSDRSYELRIEKQDNEQELSFQELRKNVYDSLVDIPNYNKLRQIKSIKRINIIREYAISRSNGNCEGCNSEAPFLKKNGQPYLEVHHMKELSKEGSDSPLNVSALCPNCHARITYGIDGKDFNNILINKIFEVEQKLNY